MEYISRTDQYGIARVMIRRGKVNAFNDAVSDEMSRTFGELALDPSVRAIILTGHGEVFLLRVRHPPGWSKSRAGTIS